MSELGYHFLADKNGAPVYRDGKPARIGDLLTHDGPLLLCQSGLHFSHRPIDALKYAPGPWLSYVRVGGEIVYDKDKGICRRREVLWLADISPILRAFGRWCAASVLHLWDAPEIVRRWIETGDNAIRAAAGAAAWAAARAAARDAARAAAWDAAWAAQNRMLSGALHEAIRLSGGRAALKAMKEKRDG